MTTLELWKKYLLEIYFHFNLFSEFLLTYTASLPKGPWRETKHLWQYCIKILKELCFTNVNWASFLKERHWVLGKEEAEGRNPKEEIQKDFPALGFVAIKAAFQGQKASEMNKTCVSGLSWILTSLTYQNWHLSTLWCFETLGGVENTWSPLWSN